jgi:N-carbamoyl-L-amino-acid hydrolase
VSQLQVRARELAISVTILIYSVEGRSMMDVSKLRVNRKRLQKALEDMATIGATPGKGVQRLALSDEDKQARDLFVHWLQDLRLDVTIDEMGNIFGKRDGKHDNLSPIVTGSHLDSQPNGGRFDGALGVLGSLEVLRTLNENNIDTIRPIILVNWTNEEGTRFAPDMMGSGVWTGALDKDWVYQRTDITGTRVIEELERIGYRGETPATGWPIHGYYEYHIEQGPILERNNKLIGVPQGIVSLLWFDIYLEGEANQVGPTPMDGRHDALCAAAEMILKVNHLPQKMGGNLVATVGAIHNSPNSRNIISDNVHFTVDIRSWDDMHALNAWSDLHRDFEAIAYRRGCPIKIEETSRVEHALFDQGLVKRVSDIAQELEYSHQSMVSGAGHDASYINQIASTAMIFVPSIDGRSHVEVENTSWSDCEAGANVLLHCVLKSANETN